MQRSVVLVYLHLLDKFESSFPNCLLTTEIYTSWTLFHTSAMATRNNQPLSGECPSEEKVKTACNPPANVGSMRHPCRRPWHEQMGPDDDSQNQLLRKLGDAGKRMQHAQSLECQGQVFRCSEDGAASIWSTAVQKLPPQLLKFSLNAVQVTLPHNADLAMRRRREDLSSACKLCGKRQTLLHVLNNCPKALNLHRYNMWHDAVLEVISKFMAESLTDRYQLLAEHLQSQPYVFPPTLPQLTRSLTL